MITTCRAPACLLTIAAIMPIGPAPVTKTSSPSMGKASAVWTALPKGSKIAATSGSMGSRCTQALPDGKARYSAKAPATVDANDSGVNTQMAPPGPAVATPTADQVSLAADQIAYRNVADARTDLDNLAGELMAHRHRRLQSPLRPLVPRLDMQVGAANSRRPDLDQHIPCPDRGQQEHRPAQALVPVSSSRGPSPATSHIATLPHCS